jgi:hypothetical protein
MIKTHSECYFAVDDQENIMSTTTAHQQQLTVMLEVVDQLLDSDNSTVKSHSDDDSTIEPLESDFSKNSEVEILSNSSTRRRTRPAPTPTLRSRRWVQEEIELNLSLERSDSLENFRRRRLRRRQQSLQKNDRSDPYGSLEEDSLHLSRSRIPLSSRIVRREPQQNDDEEPWIEGEITIIPLGAPVTHRRAVVNDQPKTIETHHVS